MSQTEGRTIQGVEIPERGDWQLDPAHTSVEFRARQLMVSNVRGRFLGVSGNIHISEDPAESWVEVTIDPASIETGNARRDEHLRTPDFFDVERHPEITFRSTRLEGDQPGGFRLQGDLTVHGVTRPVTLDVEYHGSGFWSGRRASFSATTEVDRTEFGVTWNAALEGGGVLVGKKVKLELDIEAVKQN